MSSFYVGEVEPRVRTQLCKMNIIERKHNTQTYFVTTVNTNWTKGYLFISGKLISAFAP